MANRRGGDLGDLSKEPPAENVIAKDLVTAEAAAPGIVHTQLADAPEKSADTVMMPAGPAIQSAPARSNPFAHIPKGTIIAPSIPDETVISTGTETDENVINFPGKGTSNMSASQSETALEPEDIDLSHSQPEVPLGLDMKSPAFLNEAALAAMNSISVEEAGYARDLAAVREAMDQDRQVNGQRPPQRTSMLASLFSGLGRKSSDHYLTQMQQLNDKLQGIQSRKAILARDISRMHTLWASANQNSQRYNELIQIANDAYMATGRQQKIERAVVHAMGELGITREEALRRVKAGVTTDEIDLIRRKKAEVWNDEGMKPIRDQYQDANRAGADLLQNLEAMKWTLERLENNGVDIDKFHPLASEVQKEIAQAITEEPAIQDPDAPSFHDQIKERIDALREFFNALFAKIGGALGLGQKPNGAVAEPRLSM